MAAPSSGMTLKRGMSLSIPRREQQQQQHSSIITEKDKKEKEKVKEKEREKEKRMTKSASVTDPVRIKRLLEKSQEENALLMQQIKELQLRYEKEQEKCQA